MLQTVISVCTKINWFIYKVNKLKKIKQLIYLDYFINENKYRVQKVIEL